MKRMRMIQWNEENGCRGKDDKMKEERNAWRDGNNDREHEDSNDQETCSKSWS